MSDKDREYQRLACDLLGLIHPADRDGCKDMLLELGTFRIIDSEIITSHIVETYLSKLRGVVQEVSEALREEEKTMDWQSVQRLPELKGKIDELVRSKACLTPAEFYQYNGRGDAEEKRETFARGRAVVKYVARKELARLQRFVSFASDFQGVLPVYRSRLPYPLLSTEPGHPGAGAGEEPHRNTPTSFRPLARVNLSS